MKSINTAKLGMLSLVLAVTACGAAGSRLQATVPGGVVPARAAASTCGRIHPAARTAVPFGGVRAGSTVALATWGGRTLAFAADEDDSAVHVIDVDAKKELGEIAVDGRPSQLMFLPDARLAVLLRDRSQVLVLEPGDGKPETLEKRCAVSTLR